ncbi:MAG: FAD-binding protein [Phycisphaerae bacterium]|nr:FAD-binding protein [Phycisphaerae bacterium]
MSGQTDDVCDVLVVGAGAAGLAAAIRARELGLSVTVLERDELPREQRCAAWLSPPAVTFCEQWGIQAKAAKAQPFKGLNLHSWDMAQHVSVADEDLFGWLIDSTLFEQSLARVAQKRGVVIRSGVRPVALDLSETCATLLIEGGVAARGKVLLIADGPRSQLARQANLGPRTTGDFHTWCVHAVAVTRKASPGLDVVIGGGRAAQLGIIVRTENAVRVTVVGRAGADELAAEMRGFCRSAASIVPELGADIVVGEVLPVGVALDLETHVGKRCLLIGDAGGFVAAFSTEALYPAMQSGTIAAEVVARALGAELMQEELSTFGVEWRQRLADYLRTPSTDLSLLLPLVFRNEQMSQRVARAFLLGTEF